jgi:hypothetical protein
LRLRERVDTALIAGGPRTHPARWIGKVTVIYWIVSVLQNGHGTVSMGDPGNTLSRDEITAKA